MATADHDAAPPTVGTSLPRDASAPSVELAERFRRERALTSLIEELTRVSDVPKLLRQSLGAIGEMFGATAGIVAFQDTHDAPVVRAASFGLPAIDESLLAAFIAQRRPSLPDTMILAPLTRGNHTIGVLGLERPDPFARGDGRFLARATRHVSLEVERREEHRVVTVLERISAKIVLEIRPNDLFYQILHGLRDLLRYDHSSALYLYDADRCCLRLRAEQISYAKAKSTEIGRIISVDPSLQARVRGEALVHVVTRSHTSWDGVDPWAALSAQLAGATLDAPPERAHVLIPVVYRGGSWGVIKVASRRADAFGPREARIAARLQPFAAAALAHAQEAQRFETQLMETEKRAAMSDLARGVAHDVNNALGVIVPLTEQLEAEFEEGDVDLADAREDLAEISRAARLAKRIMAGMLHYARGGSATRTRLDLSTVLQTASVLLGPRLTTKSVTLERAIDPSAAHVYAAQAHVERILLNLLLNAYDASPLGGRILVRSAPAAAADGGSGFVSITVEDRGDGIPTEILAQVEEPFFTTKPGGTGLGLAICRSLAWENGGRLFIQSERGRGTSVRVILPTSAGTAPAEDRDGT